MTTVKSTVIFVFLSLLTLGSNANAADMSNYYSDLFSNFNGPTLGKINSYSSDNHGVQGTTKADAINFDSELTTAYIIDKDKMIGIGPDIPFVYAPVLGQKFTLGDVGVKAFDKKTIDANGWRVYTNLLLQLPTSDASRNRNLKLGIKTTPYFWYSFPKTNWTVGAWTEEKVYAGVTVGKLYKLYAEPYINYAFSDRFSLNLAYEMEFHHDVGMPGLKFTTYERDLEPGFNWSITKNIFVNPYLLFFLADKVTKDTIGIAMVISIHLL